MKGWSLETAEGARCILKRKREMAAESEKRAGGGVSAARGTMANERDGARARHIERGRECEEDGERERDLNKKNQWEVKTLQFEVGLIPGCRCTRIRYLCT